MAQSIQGSVGQGGRNLGADVKIVQALLNNVPTLQGGPSPKLVVDGLVGPKTTGAIFAFQRKQFGQSHADGRVDPGQRTFNSLLALGPPSGPDTNFTGGFTPDQIQGIKDDVARGQRMIDNAMSLMALAPFLNANAPGPTDVVKMLAFNFGIDFSDKSNPINLAFQSTLLVQLQARFATLRGSISPQLPFVLEQAPPPGSFAADAFVIGTDDPTIHIVPQYFDRPADERSAILVPEHAHTKFKTAGHPGMGGGLAVLVVGPTDDKRPFFQPPGRFLDQSLNNPFCYEWLIRALDNGASARSLNLNCLCATTP
jgi:hypothetical protein